MKTTGHLHFIGICGVGMSALAIAFHKQGYKVTGSDAGFFPPISTHLEKAGINFYPGWHPDKMTASGQPDLVVVGNVASSTNPEWLYVQKHGLKYQSYPELIADHMVRPNSIVCAGTYGKTSTSSLLTWILKEAGYDPSYMFGGLSLNSIDAAGIGQSNWSVLEGDEYKTARWDNRPKFSLYSPTHLLLTAVKWDHADVYPTEADYLKAFEKLVASVPDSGLIVACTNSPNVEKILKAKSCKLVTYGQSGSDYEYNNINQDKQGLTFEIKNGDEIFKIKSPLLGAHMAENICGAFAMASEIGIDPAKIVEVIESFKGIKRRLEKRYEGRVTVFDDIAHSPEKARFTLKSLREVYPDSKIVAVFEPNTGNRKEAALPGYINAFAQADAVIIPRLTKVKIGEDKNLDGQKLAQAISNANYTEDDDQLVQQAVEEAGLGGVIVFLGSHGFRSMIEKVIDQQNKQNKN